MTFTATQYLNKGAIYSATTTATGSATTVSRVSIIALSLTNTATTNLTTYADVHLFDGTTAVPFLVKVPLYPGGALGVAELQHHTLPTGGAVYITPYATFVSSWISEVEIT